MSDSAYSFGDAKLPRFATLVAFIPVFPAAFYFAFWLCITLTQLFRVRRTAKALQVRDTGELQILG